MLASHHIFERKSHGIRFVVSSASTSVTAMLLSHKLGPDGESVGLAVCVLWLGRPSE